jgi:3-hydroxy-9,10-secoandrosta-1,3,5(10)-triene-9,17-dione monooxygenase reductase component
MSIKDAMSRFTTGVTVVTTHHDGQDWGMTCNSFNTVSLDPAMVLWSIRKEANSHHAFTQSGSYLVNVLQADQKDTALRFATGPQSQRFADQACERTEHNNVKLMGSVAWFECRLTQIVSAGDHDILIGEVMHFGSQDGEGLAYGNRHFGVLNAFES